MKMYAFNNDYDKAQKLSDPLCSRMPRDTQCFCSAEFAASLKFSDDQLILYVGHIKDTQLAQLIEVLKDKESVLIRCSSVGRAEHRHRRMGKLTILELRPDFHALGKNDWAATFSWISQCSKVLLEKIEGDITPRLRGFFGCSDPLEHLKSLSILCQGYLVARAETKDVLVCDALRKMGWDVSDESIVARKIKSMSLGSEVVKPAFWDVFDVESGGDKAKRIRKLHVTVLAAVQKEWGQDNDAEVEPVRNIIGLLGNEMSDPIPVARAYLSLAKRLGAQNVT